MSKLPESAREALPPRRPLISETIEYANSKGEPVSHPAQIGFNPTLEPKEIFIGGSKEGTDMRAVIDDASVIVSVALQYGVPAAAFAKSISRVPVELDGPPVKPNSIIGAAVDRLAELERKTGEQIAEELPCH